MWTTLQYADGDIAEVAIWNVALTGAEMAALAAGAPPGTVSPSALVFYAPIYGTQSPEKDLISANNLTVTGATASSAYPPINAQAWYTSPFARENPRRLIPSPQRFDVAASLNLPLYFYVPPPPFRQGDWPNPVRRVNAPAWQQSVAQSLSIPRDADYVYGLVWIAVNGVARAQGRSGNGSIDFASLTITDELDQTPNTCQFVARGFTPTVGQSVIITLGSATIQNPERIFAGTILQVKQMYSGTPANQTFQVSCIDWTWQLNKRKVIKQYSATSAAAIAIDLIATYAPSFTCNHVAGLGVIDLISFTNVDLTDALTQLAKRAGGYWYVDYTKDLHVFVTEGVTPPTPLTAAHPSLTDFAITRDLSQWVTRQYAEGGGGNAAAAVAVGDTILPLDVASWYPVTGGVVVCGSQRVSYTAVQVGGGGSLVGPGASPAAAPALALVVGSGLGVGGYQYAYTAVTAAGESLPSPLGTITTGLTAAPSGAPTAGAPQAGTGLDAGSHDYEVTFVTASGETTPSPVSGQVTASSASDPSVIGTLGGQVDINSAFPGGSGSYGWAYTMRRVSDGAETNLSPVRAATGNWGGTAASIALAGCDAPPSGYVRQWYRTALNGSIYKRVPTGTSINGSTTVFSGYEASGFFWDHSADASLGASAPASNGTALQIVPLTAIPLGDAPVTSRKLYRRFNGAGAFKFVTTIANNSATTYTDTTPNASLGAAAPSSNTATAQQVSVTGIGIGATPTTSRKVYRTAVGALQLKLLTTLANNTTTTFADSTADGSLGANAPTSDASALTQPTGQILAGAITLLVAGPGAFSASGGWAIVGNGQQVIRYTGISGNTLTGIPASGTGAITATVSYNSTATAAPALTGIPASGSGAIVYAIPAGAPVNLLAQVDDLAGQTALAALIGGDGVQEAYVQDGRIAYTEALARATARQAVNNSIREAIAYVVRDPQTASGRTIVVNLVAPTSVSASYKIQRVTITQFSAAAGLFPTYTAEASSDKVSFENALATLIAKGRATP